MNKPEPIDIPYYDWIDCWDYLVEKYGFTDEIDKVKYPKAAKKYFCVWNWIIDTQGVYNGTLITFSNYPLLVDGGDDFMCPDFFKDILIAIIDEFGVDNPGCILPGSKHCNFHACW